MSKGWVKKEKLMCALGVTVAGAGEPNVVSVSWGKTRTVSPLRATSVRRHLNTVRLLLPFPENQLRIFHPVTCRRSGTQSRVWNKATFIGSTGMTCGSLRRRRACRKRRNLGAVNAGVGGSTGNYPFSLAQNVQPLKPESQNARLPEASSAPDRE